MEKPIKAKPHFYACCFLELQKIAVESGYNLLLHGSMSRDMDLVAVPWINNPKTHLELLQSFSLFLNGVYYEEIEPGYMFSMLPGGRSSYIINLNRGGKYNHYVDEQYYLDISITPLLP